MSNPESLNALLDIVLAAKPKVWYPCDRCRVDNSRPGLCWDCQKDSERDREKRERLFAMRGRIPDNYRLRLDYTRLRERGITNEHVKWAEKYMTFPKLMIHGERSGSGKSSLLGAMAHEWCGHNDGDFRWVSAFELCGAELKLDPGIAFANLVCLDDVGNERDMRSTLVPELFEVRYANNRPLWVTTSLSYGAFANRYGDNNARRLFSSQQTKALRLAGRRAEAAE